MVAWKDFEAEAPAIAELFLRRHKATGNLCFLATIRSDGYPRISPMEPTIFDGRLILVGMPNTLKFKDLLRNPKFSLHTATVDPYVGEGDAKVWGEAVNERDPSLHERFAQHLFEASGMDLRGQAFETFLVGDVTGASSLEFKNRRLTVLSWKPGDGVRSRRIG